MWWSVSGYLIPNYSRWRTNHNLEDRKFRLLRMRRRSHLETSETNYPVAKSHIWEELRRQLRRYESQKTSLIKGNLCNVMKRTWQKRLKEKLDKQPRKKTLTEDAEGEPSKQPTPETLTEDADGEPRQTPQTENPDRRRLRRTQTNTQMGNPDRRSWSFGLGGSGRSESHHSIIALSEDEQRRKDTLNILLP